MKNKVIYKLKKDQRLEILNNKYIGLQLVHPKSYRLGRSDHTPFYKVGVLIMYLFDGTG